jgi:hypothetical protein
VTKQERDAVCHIAFNGKQSWPDSGPILFLCNPLPDFWFAKLKQGLEKTTEISLADQALFEGKINGERWLTSFPEQYSEPSERKRFKKMVSHLKSKGIPVVPIHVIFNEDNADIRMGGLIKSQTLNKLKGARSWRKYLRARIEALRWAIQVDQYFQNQQNPPTLARPADQLCVEQEVENLRSTAQLLEQGGFELFLTKAAGIPFLMHELGRIREQTFREVGEGTLTALDLDAFDIHYQHLILWHRETASIAGAYRLGYGPDIMRYFGPKGFYIRSLFKTKSALNPLLESSLELGRSFVASAFQQKRLPLFLLWKGISIFLNKHLEIKYIIGPVSISNQYSVISRALMVRYIKKFYYNHEMASLVKARKPFRPKLKEEVLKDILLSTDADTGSIDQIIEDIEPLKLKIPILYKKYFRQNARIIGFNSDPKFADALDGFMVAPTSGLAFGKEV